MPLSVALVWHQHQPYYRDLLSGEHMMPWVRLHGTKDYLDMALLLEEFPAMRMTINLVPSLVEQIEEFARGEAKDAWLQLAEKRADELTDDDRAALLQRFFSANFDRMIAPHARYVDLHRKRGWSNDPGELVRRVPLFTPQDWLDLQVWFHLAWTDPLHVERDASLQALFQKGAGYTEDEKHLLLAMHRSLLADILPAHRRLMEAGQLEVTTTPLCHPILPLLCDTEWARQARPEITLPEGRFRHPEDAAAQVRLALEFMEQRLGKRPAGMWPSEGSVCPEIIPILANEGVQWIATDEEVLALSLGIPPFTRDRQGRVNNMDALYRPYAIEYSGRRLAMVFRDHALSDFIGFHASSIDPQQAANTLLQSLRDIEFFLRGAEGPHLVSIILDGENCWEFYERDGLPFLRALYGGLSTDPVLRPVRVGDFIAEHPPARTLPRLHAGSWINHDFRIWIGHAEDNRSWDLLKLTRDGVVAHIEQNRAQLSEEQIATAMKALYVAEGSDWNWWYGDDHSSGMDEMFDDLYRRHLIAAHRAVGLEPPPAILMPIVQARDTGSHTPPRGHSEITLDGRETHYFEWANAGAYDPRLGGGAMHHAEGVIEAMRFGFTEAELAILVELSPSLWAQAGDARITVELLIHAPGGWRLSFALPRSGAAGAARLSAFHLNNHSAHAEFVARAAWDRALEVLVPWVSLPAEPGQQLLMQVAVSRDGQEIDRAPARTPLISQVPDADWEAAHWVV